MIHIILKEYNAFFNSSIAYIVIGIFLSSISLFVWIFPQYSILDGHYAQLDVFFSLTPYVYMFLIPAITMRSFSEEKKMRTMEILFTKPLTLTQIILGKYIAGLLLLFCATLPTIIYYYSVYELGFPKGNIDSAATFGSYIGLFLVGMVFTAIGIFASSLSYNQISAFIIAVFLCFISYDAIGQFSQLNPWASFSSTLSYLAISHHYDTLSRGIIDSRNVIFLMSVIVSMLLATKTILSINKI